MGELLTRTGTVRQHAGKPNNKSFPSETITTPTHEEIGVDRATAKRYRDVASEAPALMRKIAAEATANGAELSRGRLLKLAHKETQPAPTKIPALPEGVFNMIYADPPWQNDFRRGTGRDTENHYPTMSLSDICAECRGGAGGGGGG